MSYVIQGEIQTLRSNANSIDAQAETINTRIRAISDLIEPLRSSFIGQRASDFFGKYDTASADMAQWDDLIKQFAALLRQIANDLESVENAGS